MCGRFTRTSQRQTIGDELGVTKFVTVDLHPRYNIAPSQDIEAVVRAGDVLRLGPMRWGFVAPSAAASPTVSAPAPINARAEAIATSPLFRDAFHRRRCLVVADGFYEWRVEGRRKTPYFIYLRSQRPFGFAAIWSPGDAADGKRLATCAIITCPPNTLVASIHNRMPVILPRGARQRWLDPYAADEELRALLVPLPADDMDAHAVSTLVNSPRNDVPECVEGIDE